MKLLSGRGAAPSWLPAPHPRSGTEVVPLLGGGYRPACRRLTGRIWLLLYSLIKLNCKMPSRPAHAAPASALPVRRR